MKLLHSLLAKMTGENLASTPPEVIKDQMLEPRPLPMGKKEFDRWSDRIISGSLVPGMRVDRDKNDRDAFIISQKVSLAQMIMHLGPTESHKPDAFFIHSLRKAAANEAAWDVISTEKALKESQRKLAEEEAKKKAAEETSNIMAMANLTEEQSKMNVEAIKNNIGWTS